MEKHCV